MASNKSIYSIYLMNLFYLFNELRLTINDNTLLVFVEKVTISIYNHVITFSKKAVHFLQYTLFMLIFSGAW